MPKWEITASETVYYAFTVEADTEEEAEQEAMDYEVSSGDIIDGQDFEVLAIKRACQRVPCPNCGLPVSMPHDWDGKNPEEALCNMCAEKQEEDND